MKKSVKTAVSLLLVLAIAISGSALAYDEDTGMESRHKSAYELAQELFPGVPVTRDGYVEDFDATENIESMSAEEIMDMYNSPVETYKKVAEDGVHYLDVYADGSYSVYGIEEIQQESKGYGTSGPSGNLKVYWNLAAAAGEFQMYYYVSCGLSGSSVTLSRVSSFCLVARTGTLPSLGYTIASGTVYAYSQTSTSNANAYSTAKVALNGVNSFGMKLKVAVTYSSGFIYSVTASSVGV